MAESSSRGVTLGGAFGFLAERGGNFGWKGRQSTLSVGIGEWWLLWAVVMENQRVVSGRGLLGKSMVQVLENEFLEPW